MNTRFLMLLAALLLGSASAFAQSGNTTTLNGDVNGDGVVDVADINAIINIIKNNAGTATAYKYYVGTTDPSKTTWNESDLTMSSQNPITSFTAPAGTSDNPFTVWIYPTSWGTINSMN